jgi:hypothetical protein
MQAQIHTHTLNKQFDIQQCNRKNEHLKKYAEAKKHNGHIKSTSIRLNKTDIATWSA